MYVRAFKPSHDDLNLVLVKDGLIKVFAGVTIPDFCYVNISIDPGKIDFFEGVDKYIFSDRVLISTPDWKQLGMMMSEYSLAVIKPIVRSAFPVHALKFDKVRLVDSKEIIDATEWAEYEWQVKLPSMSSVRYYGYNRSRILPDGQKLVIAINPVCDDGPTELPVPRVLSPRNARLLSVSYQLNDGKPYHGQMLMKFIVPPKPVKVPKAKKAK